MSDYDAINAYAKRLEKEIVKRARSIAAEMAVGTMTTVNGEQIPRAHLILSQCANAAASS